MFRKSKIESSIDNNTVAYNSADFDSLDIVSKKLKNKRIVNKIFITPLQNCGQDIVLKYKNTTKYIQTHLNFIFKWSLYSLLLTVFILLNILLFSPFYGAIAGENFAVVSNFWMAALNNGNVVYSITPLAISFIVLLFLSIGFFIGYYFYSRKQFAIHQKNEKLWIDNKTKTNTIISFSAYACAFTALLLILITVLIPPNASNINATTQQELTNAIAFIQANISNPTPTPEIEATLRVSIEFVYSHFGIAIPTGTIQEISAQYSIDLTKGLFNTSSMYDNYWFFADVYKASASQLSVAGIIITVFYAVLISAGALILPTTIIYLNTHKYYAENKKKDPTWNFYNTVIYYLMRITSKNYVQGAKNVKIKHKEKRAAKKLARETNQTYAKFKKQNREEGQTIDEASFNSNQVDNAAINVITKDEIESHEANKAFLNVDGDWMYHDGANNYYIAKNDAWIKYDITKEIHKVHTDAHAKLDLDPSKKQYKEGRFRKAKRKQASVIALPDNDLDEIIKKLDI